MLSGDTKVSVCVVHRPKCMHEIVLFEPVFSSSCGDYKVLR